ncbi:hypothetical protein L2E82_25886 [Cichorium intybus]|uniref:Uncharacterized protein n=1 Tax=Cichorium intybus TaxID=13427 RepID=A0ACB9E5S1_CICIN|nr:hypothetical protein L2E82_25886 [Cichorium intybus]
MNGNSNTELASTLSPRRSNINEKRVSFDIENDSDEGLKYQNTDYEDNHKHVLSTSQNPIFIADVLKTLFLILVWYNKTLLGDDMGKFPAPLLMNTIHFSMQAVLSKAITYFCFNINATDPICISQLYQQLLEQHLISI